MNYAAVGTVRREKKGETGTVVWIEGYDPVDLASVYIRYTGFIFF